MTHEELKKLEENIDKYKKALSLVYADGDVTSVERNRLISLKNELGLSDSICMVMESNFHEVADQDAIDLEKAKKIHHCRLCDGDGAIKWHGIDHSMVEYIEVGDTYIEASNGGSYTGLREPFVLSIGQSFEELLDKYGERHIYDAVNDGRLQVFDEQNDLETYLKLRFDIREEEKVISDYQKKAERDWEQKYIFLSSDKLHSFINEESFTKDMAQMIICDFEGDGSPLVIDELGNVCEKNIWETEEGNAITAYMPSGITTKEIEILDSYLTGHPDIPAKKRVEVLKLKDTLEEINERLIEREEKQEFLEKEKASKINTETFENIPQWAVTYLAYGDKDGLSDEDIALVDNWAKRNQINSFIDAGEEHYFSSHPKFGPASDCVTATFTLRERTRTEKELVDEYISKVKENLSSTSKTAVEEVFESSKIALQSFSDNEKKIIGKYLFDNGATNDVNLGKLLKQKIEPGHKKEIKREIDFERVR